MLTRHELYGLKKDKIDKYNNGFKGKMFTQVNYLTCDFVKKYICR